MEQVKAVIINTDSIKEEDVLVAREVPLTIIVNGKELVTLLCTPEDLEDLARGFLFTAGLIQNVRDVKKIVADTQQWTVQVELNRELSEQEMVFKRVYTSGCGGGILFYNTFDIMNRKKNTSDMKMNPAAISLLMGRFQTLSPRYLKTRGVHSAALCDGKTIPIFKEDIGRHNAIDKVIGAGLAKDFSFAKSAIFTSGRISSEVIYKIQKAGIPIVISKSAPTDQAVKLSRKLGITAVGLARGNTMNIYSEERRIIV